MPKTIKLARLKAIPLFYGTPTSLNTLFRPEICTGPDFVGPARPGPARRSHGPARPGPRPEFEFRARPVSARGMAKPGPARPGPVGSGPTKQFPWDFLKLFNLIKQYLFNGFVGYLFVTDAPQG